MQTGSVPTFGVTGELHDGAAGLVTLRARWYNARNGTFTAVDPFVGFAEQPYSQHPYQYAYSNPVVWTDPSGQVSIVDGGGGPRCIPIVERWDPVLQRCVPDLRPPLPNNRLTNDAARSYAQAFEDLVGAPAADVGILTTDVAIPYPGIGGFPRVGIPRIGLTPAQRRAALPAALAALGCPLLTGDQADVRTQPRDDEQRLPLYHYTDAQGFTAIFASGVIRANARNMVFVSPMQFSPDEAFYILFIGNPLYKGKGDYVVQFIPREGTIFVPGTQPSELIHYGSLRNGRNIDISYIGSNPF